MYKLNIVQMKTSIRRLSQVGYKGGIMLGFTVEWF